MLFRIQYISITKGEVELEYQSVFYGTQYEPLGFYVKVINAATKEPVTDGTIELKLAKENVTLQENIDKVDNKLFIGTQEEYDAAYAEGKVAVGALVIILDEDINEDTATVSVLGQGVLGTLVLGKELK